MQFKDYFSDESSNYSKYRPDCPLEMYQFIISKVESRKLAWDCGTGNGQAALQIASYFDNVFASDASAEQIDNTIQKENISYFVCKAEKTPFKNQQFDLVTVAQAIHWFDFGEFWKELRRVIKPNGIFACWTYTLLYSNETAIQSNFEDYFSKVDTYWPKERDFVKEKYETIPFPKDFEIIESPNFEISRTLSLQQAMNYLRTWSSNKQYLKMNNIDPVDELEEEMEKVWDSNTEKVITHPVYLKLFKIP